MALEQAHFDDSLATQALGRRLLSFESVETTMTIARDEAAAGAPHGTVIFAEEQTAGRGRRGRGFHSPRGENLYFTFILRLDAPVAKQLPLAVPLAVCEAVRGCGVDALIKWPNDIWAGERKLSGMLIDAETVSGGVIAYPGIGINVNGDPTAIPELREIATSVRRELGEPVSRERLLATVCNELERCLGAGPLALAERYRELSLVIGRAVTVQPAHGDAFEGTATDIAPDGSLVVRRADGREETVTAADVSVRPRA